MGPCLSACACLRPYCESTLPLKLLQCDDGNGSGGGVFRYCACIASSQCRYHVETIRTRFPRPSLVPRDTVERGNGCASVTAHEDTACETRFSPCRALTVCMGVNRTIVRTAANLMKRNQAMKQSLVLEYWTLWGAPCDASSRGRTVKVQQGYHKATTEDAEVSGSD